MKRTRLYVLGILLLASCHQPGTMDEYHGCGITGDARSASVMELNTEKNRYDFPDSLQIDHRITLQAMLAPGYDRNRFKDGEAAEVTGYVYAVRVGGVESCNCQARDPEYRDTHIELVASADRGDEDRCVIAEVTPRMRDIMAKRGIDWSTDNLRNTIQGHYVTIAGWLMFDFEHDRQAHNTAPRNHKDWRETCWEIHPITSIKLVSQPI